MSKIQEIYEKIEQKLLETFNNMEPCNVKKETTITPTTPATIVKCACCANNCHQ